MTDCLLHHATGIMRLMDKKEIQQQLSAHASPYSSEQAFVKETQLFVETQQRWYDRNLTLGHLVASGFIFDPTADKILLTYHRKLKRWLQPGGHLESTDLSIIAAARREIWEESGLDRFMNTPDGIFDLDIHEIPENKGFPAHKHYDIRYLFLADSEVPLSISDESLALEWHEIARYKETAVDDSAIRICNKLIGMQQEPYRLQG